jgi:hypothetical protein
MRRGPVRFARKSCFNNGELVMRSLLTCAVLGAGLLVVGPVQAQEAVSLQWKLAVGKTFYVQTHQDTDMTMNVKLLGNVQTQKQKQKQTTYHSWTVKEQTPTGGWVVVQKLLANKVDMDMNGQKIVVDSTKGIYPATGGAAFKAMIGCEFTMTLDKDLKVVKIEGREAFLQKLVGLQPAEKAVLEETFSEDTLKKGFDEAFGFLPSNPVKPGDNWIRQATMSMGGMGKVRAQSKYTYQGPADNLQKIIVDMTFQWLPADPNGLCLRRQLS